MKEDDGAKMTIGAINNRDGTYTPEFHKQNGVARDVHGSAYSNDHVNSRKKETQQVNVNDAVTMEGTAHYEPALTEMLYHLRLHNTHPVDFPGLLIVTTTLPQGSKPGHCYWIRNRKRNPGERAEQHDCFVKRLTVTCRVHKLAPGQLATVYLHNKQRETGLGPAHTSLTVDGKVRSTTSL